MDRTVTDARAEQFAALRPYLLRFAYSHLGTVGEAEDALQETWIRLQRTEGEIANLRAWCTTTLGRICLDALTSARARRETYVGTWLPEPVVAPEDAAAGDPAGHVTLDESVSMALLVVLESLTPAERCAFLLHDVFGFRFEEVAGVVGRTPAAARQLASRGRRAVRAGRPRRPVARDEQRAVVEAFVRATGEGDLDALIALLDPEAVYRGDGGGNASAPRVPVRGARRVAKALIAMARKYRDTMSAQTVDVNGLPGLMVTSEAGSTVVSFTLEGGRIRDIDGVRNPDKLARL